ALRVSSPRGTHTSSAMGVRGPPCDPPRGAPPLRGAAPLYVTPCPGALTRDYGGSSRPPCDPPRTAPLLHSAVPLYVSARPGALTHHLRWVFAAPLRDQRRPATRYSSERMRWTLYA